MLIHASCVVIDDKAVLLRGPSRSGKSDLALRLIELGFTLVADDQIELIMDGSDLLGSAPAPLAGLIELRQVGVLRMPYQTTARIALSVNLALVNEPLERLPEVCYDELCGCTLVALRLHAFEASTPAKIKAFLAYGAITHL